MIPLGRYEHYKGQQYKVIGFAHHTETKEKMVLYQPLYDVPELNEAYNNNVIFTRPYDMFNETILVNNQKIKRFRFLESESQHKPSP